MNDESLKTIDLLRENFLELQSLMPVIELSSENDALFEKSMADLDHQFKKDVPELDVVRDLLLTVVGIFDKIDAIEIVKYVGKIIDGGGGGKTHLATAGGKNKEGIQELMSETEKYILEININRFKIRVIKFAINIGVEEIL